MNSVKGTYAAPRRKWRLLAAASVTTLVVGLVPAMGALAVPEPIAGGTTTLTFELPKKVKPQAISPATANGNAITFNNATGTADLSQGRADVTLGGGVRLKGRGGKAELTAIKLIAGGSGAISGQLKGKTVEIATVSGPLESSSSAASITNAPAVLTEDGAKALNKALAKKKKGKGKATASKKGGKPFKPGNRLATVTSAVPLTMVDVRAEGELVLEPAIGSAFTFLGKGVNAVTGGISAVPPASGAPPAPFRFPVTGGRVSPDLSAGRITSAGGLNILKNMSNGSACDGVRPLGTFLRQTDLIIDFNRSAMLATADANQGNLGTGIVAADLDMSAATKSVSPSGAVEVEGMEVKITAISATTLNFIFGSSAQSCGADFAPGDSLGHLSVTTQLG
jgi:hypothetical protein